jgi:hypothetical protein
MSTITVSNTGGNWNATGTWVGGVVPLSTDTVAFTATSGNLTVNVASICAGFDMTNYSAGKTITFTSALTVNGSFNMGSGSYTQAGASGIIMGASGTITSNGVTWSRTLNFTGTSQTYTLAGDITTSGLLTFSPTTTMTFAGAYNINVLAGLTVSGVSNAVISGTSTAIIIKGGTWNHVLATYINNNVTINPTTTITLGANIFYAVGTLTYSSSGGGTLITTASTLTCNNSVTFATNGMTWNNVTINGASTVTLSSAFSCNTLQLNNYSITFAGSYGFSVGSLVGSGISGKTITLVSGNTYTIGSTAFTFNTGTSAAHNVFKSSTGGVKAILTLQNGASQDLSFVDFTDIDASLGKILCTYKGTLSNTNNIRLLPTDFITVSY